MLRAPCCPSGAPQMLATPDDRYRRRDLRHRLPRHDPRRTAVRAAGPHGRGAARRDRTRRHRRPHAGAGGAVDPFADAAVALLLHGDLGPDAPGRLLWLGHVTHRRAPARAERAARRGDRGGGGAVGGVQQRHRLPGDRAGARRGVPAARSRSGAVPARACVRGEHRLGGDAYRQPAEHADRRGAEDAVRRLLPGGGRAGRARPGGAVAAARLGDARQAAGRGGEAARCRRPRPARAG